jgi:hypothetical protein
MAIVLQHSVRVLAFVLHEVVIIVSAIVGVRVGVDVVVRQGGVLSSRRVIGVADAT